MKQKFKKCVRYNTAGHAHVLTFSCCNSLPLLQDDLVKQFFVDSLQAARERHRFDLWAYVVMPEHVHLMLWPREDAYSISRILAGIKRPVAYRARKLGLGQGPRFWQAGGGYDRNVWAGPAIHKEIAYLHANPVRRGLCESPEDWRYSSAGFWASESDVPLAMDESLPPEKG